MTREEQLNTIKSADNAYYNLNNPTMTDQEYDALRTDYIEKYGSDDLNYVPGNSITSRKFKHPIEVTSLAKVDEDEVAKLKSEIKRLGSVVIEPKYDGLTVVAYPKEDGSYFFVTRGSGNEGDILKYFNDENLAGSNTKYAIRGEAFMNQENFEKMNADLIKNGEEPKANPRNAAAGILNPARKEVSPYLNLISYICYDVIGLDVSESEKLNYITANTPFEPTSFYVFNSDDDLDTIVKYISNRRNEIVENNTYPIDGMVVKSNEDGSLKKFGSTDHHPKNAFAVKSCQSAVYSILKNVSWQLGKTGALTPIAEFDPIHILGSTVSKASLSNPDEIKRLGLKIGDNIGVIKAREIIPKVVINNGGGNKDIVIPDKCPSCGQSLIKNGPVLQCQNELCNEKIAQKIAFMGSKKVLNIDGLSIQTARKIVNYFYDNYTDLLESEGQNIIFYLKKEDILKLDGFSEKSANNLYKSIQDATTPNKVSIPRFIKACCVDSIGEDVGKILAMEYGSLQSMYDALSPTMRSKDEYTFIHDKLNGLDGIGKETAKIVLSEDFWTSINNLWSYIEPTDYELPNTESSNSNISGKVFVLTGKMPKKRNEYEAMITSKGGIVAGSVSKNTDYLVIADVSSTSSKAVKARKLGTKLISPEELEELL